MIEIMRTTTGQFIADDCELDEGGHVKKWVDTSGNGNDIVQGNPYRRPKLNKVFTISLVAKNSCEALGMKSLSRRLKPTEYTCASFGGARAPVCEALSMKMPGVSK